MKKRKKNKKRESKKIMVEDIDIGRFFELSTTNKRCVNGVNLHEIRKEILKNYTGAFELIGSMLIGEIEQKTNIRFKNVDVFEKCINAIDNSGYDSDVVFFTGRL